MRFLAVLPFLLFPAFAQSDLAAGAPWRLAGNGELQTVRAEGAPGGNENALRITTRTATPTSPWSTQLTAVVPRAIDEGQWLRYRLWARSAEAARIEIIHELNGEPYSKSLSYQIQLTPAWKEFAIPYPSAQYVAAASALRVRTGFNAGVVELAGLRLEDFGRAAEPPSAVNFDPYGGQEVSDGWKEAAQERIERYRKGPLRIQVMTPDGEPVPMAEVKLEQTYSKYLFGTAVADGALLGTGENADRYRAELLRLFNYAVLENALKWNFRDGDFSTADRMLTWLKDHDIPVRGHTLLWPSYQHLPSSARALRGEPLRKAVEQHVRDYVTRTRDRVVVWDVINESVTNTEVIRDAGRDMLWLPYLWAREADPKVALAYNDYNISNTRGGVSDAHRKTAIQNLLTMLDNGANITVVGDQGHMNTPLTPIPRVLETWDEYTVHGQALEVTEFDVTFGGPRDEAAQAKYFEDYLTAAFSYPRSCSFLLWGFWDGAHWLGSQGAGMFRQDWSRRPMLDVWERLVLNEWMSKFTANTNDNGYVERRVFLGEHTITVKVGEQIYTTEVYVGDNEDKLTEITVEVPRQGIE